MITFKEYLLESPATVAMAKQMGLQYYQFGRWGKSGKVTHETKINRLVPVNLPYNPKKIGETALKHLEHLDDLPFNEGHAGVQHAIDILLAAKHQDERILSTIKLDGSPSLIIKNDNGRVAVATKSAFNKTPKINYNVDDVERNHGHAPGLAVKLNQSLAHLGKIHPHGIHQGDVLFGEDDKKVMDIDGVRHVTFKPNTIRYAVSLDSEMGRKIDRAKFGIAIHSKYNEHGVLEPAHNSKFDEHPDVFVLPVEHSVEKYENAQFDQEVRDLGKLYQHTHPTTLQFISNPEYAPLFKQYINSRIRTGDSIGFATNFIDWYSDKVNKDIQKLKKVDAKESRLASLKEDLRFFGDNAHHINVAFAISSSIARAKEHLITHFNKYVEMKHYLDTDEGLKLTNPEGFVVHSYKGPTKLVDRSEFSRANFQMSANRK